MTGWVIHSLHHCFVASWTHWFIDALLRCSIASLTHWVMFFLIHKFSGSVVRSVSRALILSGHVIGISITICSFVGAPHNFNISLLLHPKNFPIGHLFCFRNVRPGTGRALPPINYRYVILSSTIVVLNHVLSKMLMNVTDILMVFHSRAIGWNFASWFNVMYIITSLSSQTTRIADSSQFHSFTWLSHESHITSVSH